MKTISSLTLFVFLFSLGLGQSEDNTLRKNYTSQFRGKVTKTESAGGHSEFVLDRSKKIFDENQDKIFENLSARISTARPEDQIPVIILYRENTPTAGTYKTRLQQTISNKKAKYVYKNLPAVATNLTPSEIEKMRNDPWVEHIELDAIAKASMNTAPQWFGVWKVKINHHFSGDLDGTQGNYTVNDVVIAVADTGIDTNHPDLKDKILVWNDYVNGVTSPYDDNGHGTHVAGIAAGSGRKSFFFQGVAREAALVGLKVLDKDGIGNVSNIIQAVDDTILNKSQFNIRILNLSLSVSGSSDGKDALSKICNRAVSSGIVVVVAAGNEGPGARTIGSPGAANSVITVGAGADVGKRGFYLAEFSSRGPTADGRIKPDLWAPGVELVSPNRNKNYSAVDGTSFAAPFVSGVVALMIDANKNLRPAAIKSILTSTVQRWAGARNSEAGFGRLQAYQAVTRAAGITSNLDPPVVPHIGYIKTTIAAKQQDSYVVNITDKFPIAITLVELNEQVDLDLELVDSNGKIIAEAKTIKRQEAVILPAYAIENGTYTIRVISYLGSSGYLLNLSGDWSQ